jgi:hypothetical protein
MKKDLWSLITIVCILFFVANTLGVIELIDVLVLGKPFITIFLTVFVFCFYLNLKIYKSVSNKNFDFIQEILEVGKNK